MGSIKWSDIVDFMSEDELVAEQRAMSLLLLASNLLHDIKAKKGKNAEAVGIHAGSWELGASEWVGTQIESSVASFLRQGSLIYGIKQLREVIVSKHGHLPSLEASRIACLLWIQKITPFESTGDCLQAARKILESGRHRRLISPGASSAKTYETQVMEYVLRNLVDCFVNRGLLTFASQFRRFIPGSEYVVSYGSQDMVHVEALINQNLMDYGYFAGV
jgi:hypothetical protein